MGGKIYFADDIEKMFPDPIGDYGLALEELLDEEVPGALKRFRRVSSDMGSLMGKIRKKFPDAGFVISSGGSLYITLGPGYSLRDGERQATAHVSALLSASASGPQIGRLDF